MKKKKKPLGRLPGDPSKVELIARIIRVNQAGEYGAKRIYDGQLSVLGGTRDEGLLKEMARQEQVHLEAFVHVQLRHYIPGQTVLYHVQFGLCFVLDYEQKKLGLFGQFL